MNFTKTTEQESPYNALETMGIPEILANINKEDQTVPKAVAQALPQISKLVAIIVDALKNNGRLFYLGAGTSGRLGILDASECPPTFGVPHDLVIGLIAGGDVAIRKAVEFAEDSTTQGWKDLQTHNVSSKDVVVGIAASGTTPYVNAALKMCQEQGIATGSIGCNRNSPLSQIAQYPIEVVVGPEFVTGSSRMKAGTAQKLVLNMITTATMIRLGHVKGNKMVDMQLSNQKLFTRAKNMIMSDLKVDEKTTKALLNTHKSVRLAIQNYRNENTKK